MPRWVPVMIGVVLVVMAALAVLTGVRYRDSSLVRMVKGDRAPRRAAPAPPGEPSPGASLVFPGDGDNVPLANAPVQGRSRADISGGPGGVSAVLRLSARRGMIVKVTPPDALVSVNDLAVGQASQFDSDDEIYDFPDPGGYSVRITAPGYRDREFLVTVSESARDNVAVLTAKLERAE